MGGLVGAGRTELVEAIDECRTADEVKNKMFQVLPNASEDKGIQSMIFKWKAAFESIFRDEFTSNLFKSETILTLTIDDVLYLFGRKSEEIALWIIAFVSCDVSVGFCVL